MKCDLLVLDGRHLLWRTSDAFNELSATVDGNLIGTGGVYGFLACAMRVHGKYGGKTVVAWEGVGNFRLGLFPTYKDKHLPPDSDRQEIISDMTMQEGELRKCLAALGVDQYQSNGGEADDVIARLAAEAEGRVFIYSGDSDLRQLVNERVTCVSPGFKGGADTMYDEAAVLKRHGVPPRLLAQLKALAGDTGDKIPGAVGIGAVTAAKLINHYGSLKAVLKAALTGADDWPETPRRRKLIADQAKAVLLYYKLTKIRSDIPWDHEAGERSQKAVIERFKRLRFASLCMPNELSGLLNMGGRLHVLVK